LAAREGVPRNKISGKKKMMDLAFCITVGDHPILALPFSFGVCNLLKMHNGWRCLQKKTKNFHYSLSYLILQYMYRVLNIDENKKLIAQFACKSRDELIF